LTKLHEFYTINLYNLTEKCSKRTC